MIRVLAATGNRHKLEEIRRILAACQIELVGLDSFPSVPSCQETEATFEGNARLKAAFYHRVTGLPTLADDSGLMVDALDGAPGVFSARYAGEEASDADRIRRLLMELEASGRPERTARFVCAVSFVEGGREVIQARGVREGTITDAPRGSQGFGYDPVFLVPDLGRTYAELTDEEKDSLSHRSAALEDFVRQWRQRTGGS